MQIEELKNSKSKFSNFIVNRLIKTNAKVID